MKNNKYFDEFTRIGTEWTEEHEAHKAKKQGIIDTFGWDSDELKAWYEEEAKMHFPFADGTCKAYRAWKNSDGDEVIFDEFVWEREAADFIEAFRNAGIETFVITNQSTALMENLHWFENLGCKMQGLCTIVKKDNRFGEEREEKIMGIRMKVN